MLKGTLNVWKQFKKDRLGLAGLTILFFFILIAISAPFLSPYDPQATYLSPPFSPPSSKHMLGTDDVGRDILTLLLHGSRVSIILGFLAAFLGTIFGTIIGLVSGYFGGFVDDILMRITEIFLVIPLIPLALLFALYFGPSMWHIVILFTFFGWPPTARQIRSQILSIKELPFVEGARAAGAGNLRILFIHLLPNVAGLVIANVTTRTIAAILAEAGLAFIGASDPTVISWGSMIYYAQRTGAILYGAWWTFIPPGLCISVFACGFVFLGHAIMRILNPRIK